MLIAAASGFAGAGSIFADRVGLRPIGPFFDLFALGACSAVALSVDAWVAILLSVASAAFSVLVGFAGWFRTREWTPGIRRPKPTLRSARDHDTVSVAIGYAAAVGLAGSVSTLAGIGHPYWAMATAVILFVVPADALIVFAIIVIALQFPTELFMTRNYTLALVFFTPLILIMTQLAGATEPRTLLVDRAIETIVGAAIGIGVVLAIRPWASQRT